MDSPSKKGSAPKFAPDGTEKTQNLAALGLENYEIREVHRNQICGAPYNPRFLSDQAKARLWKGLQKHGLVSPITWNSRTGHIVGGHQRLSALDSLAGTQDYTLRVAAIDVSETAEKEMNILLNNPKAQGDWDLELLRPLLEEPGIDYSAAGFEQNDLYELFGDSIREQRLAPELDEIAEKVRTLKNLYADIAGSKKVSTSDFYCVFVFRDTTERNELLKRVGLEENRFQSGADLARLLGERPAAKQTPTEKTQD